MILQDASAEYSLRKLSRAGHLTFHFFEFADPFLDLLTEAAVE